MFKSVFSTAVLAAAISGIAADSKIVCYYGSWAVYRPGLGKFDVSDIDPRLCTHIIYAFVGMTVTGDVQVLDSWRDLPSGLDGFGKFTKLRESSPETKAMVAIGGWSQGSLHFSQVAALPIIRARFVRNVVNFLRQYKFDGLDLDWEYPNQRGGQLYDKQNFVELLKELRQEFDKHGYVLSAAVAAAQGSASQSYIIPEVAKYVDFINLMTYDFNGSWNRFTGFNAPLYAATKPRDQLNVDAAVHFWLNQGAPANKIILGIPTYGRTFTLANPGSNSLGALTTGGGNPGPYTQTAGMLGYNEICELLRQGDWTVVQQNQEGVSYAVKGNQWIGYDDANSAKEKAQYATSLGLGGVMIWSLETDDFRGTCGTRYPILTALNQV